MLLSPPIVTPQNDQESDSHWVNRCMPVERQRDYPVSKVATWHGGFHIPHTDITAAINPVRAITDGEVIFCRPPTGQNTERPLNYQGPTDNGVVLLRHTLTLGTAKVAIVFYSLYMHLKQISADTLAAKGKQIKKGSALGTSGKVDGKDGFHFQICCDDENLKKLVGRNTGVLDTGKSGRSDMDYGDTHYLLPVGTRFMHSPDDKKQNQAPVYTSDWALFVTVDAKTVTTRQEDFTGSGNFTALTPVNHPTFPAREYGETIICNEAEWLYASYPGGIGWVNITGCGIHRYSDADFPHWMGWTLVDDDKDLNSQCNSSIIDKWKSQAEEGLNLQDKYDKSICYFPFEWNELTIDHRFSWLKEENPQLEKPFNAASWQRFVKHVQELCFYSQLPADVQNSLSGKIWHFNPASFITHLNKASQVEYIAVVGAQYERKPANKLSFAGQAIRYLRKYNEKNVMHTIILFNNEYKNEHIGLINKSSVLYGVNIKVISNREGLVNYLNYGNDREVIPVAQWSIFSHGVPGELAFGYEIEGGNLLNINLNNFREINCNIFSNQGRIDSYACRTGMGKLDGHSDFEPDPQPELSLAQQLANYFNVPVGAFIVRSNYEDTWGSKEQRIKHRVLGDKEFEALYQEREENKKYCGADYNVSGALNDVKAGVTPYNLPSVYVEFLPNES